MLAFLLLSLVAVLAGCSGVKAEANMHLEGQSYLHKELDEERLEYEDLNEFFAGVTPDSFARFTGASSADNLKKDEEGNDLDDSEDDDDTSSAGAGGPATKELTVKATFYDAMCNTGCTGITATGLDVRKWTPRIIAVDPKVIPLHSLVELIISGKSVGVYQAEDTGGAIKGNRIDILAASRSGAFDSGVKNNVKVRILDKTQKEKMKAFNDLKKGIQ